jgi:hypothetical protein
MNTCDDGTAANSGKDVGRQYIAMRLNEREL